MSLLTTFLQKKGDAIRECIAALEAHFDEPAVMVATKIDDTARDIAIRECLAVLAILQAKP